MDKNDEKEDPKLFLEEFVSTLHLVSQEIKEKSEYLIEEEFNVEKEIQNYQNKIIHIIQREKELQIYADEIINIKKEFQKLIKTERTKIREKIETLEEHRKELLNQREETQEKYKYYQEQEKELINIQKQHNEIGKGNETLSISQTNENFINFTNIQQLIQKYSRMSNEITNQEYELNHYANKYKEMKFLYETQRKRYEKEKEKYFHDIQTLQTLENHEKKCLEEINKRNEEYQIIINHEIQKLKEMRRIMRQEKEDIRKRRAENDEKETKIKREQKKAHQNEIERYCKRLIGTEIKRIRGYLKELEVNNKRQQINMKAKEYYDQINLAYSYHKELQGQHRQHLKESKTNFQHDSEEENERKELQMRILKLDIERCLLKQEENNYEMKKDILNEILQEEEKRKLSCIEGPHRQEEILYGIENVVTYQMKLYEIEEGIETISTKCQQLIGKLQNIRRSQYEEEYETYLQHLETKEYEIINDKT